MAIEAVFTRVVDMSLTASVATVAVALLRLALRRAPRAIVCALWAVVLLRLLCPVSLSSAVSLFGLLDAPAVEAGTTATSMAYVSALPDLVPTGPAEETAAAAPAEEAAKVTADAAPEAPAADPWAVAGAVWLAGVGIMALWAGISYFRLRWKLRTAVPLERGVYLAEGISTAFVLGLPRPKIYLPAALPTQARQHVLRHERCHLRRGDPWWKALAFAALTLHWFNPLVWLAFALAGQDMETACDEAVVRRMDGSARADYAATLLHLATGRRVGLPLAFGAGDPARRIRHLARWKKPARWVVPAAAAVCAAAAVALLTNPAPAQAPGDFGAPQLWFDEFQSDSFRWDGLREIDLDAFPGVTFRWRSEFVEAVTEQETLRLYSGAPVWSVYFADLTGDGLPELCSTVSDGAESMNHRVVIYDYAAGASYTLEDRGSYDYVLSLADGALVVTQYHHATGTVAAQGRLVYADETLRLESLPAAEAPLSPGSTYVSYQCIYWNPAGSQLRSDDTGVRYVVGEDDFTLVSRSGALPGTGDADPAVDTTGSHETRLTGVTWGWQPFPYTDAAWADLFLPQSDGAAQSLTARHAEILYQPLSDDYFLLRVDGDLWLAQLRDDGERTFLSSIHSLVSEAAMGVAQWEFAPILSSRSPYFPLTLDLPFTEGSVRCTGGALLADGQLATAADLRTGDGLFWSPLGADGELAQSAALRFALSGEAGETWTGTVYLTASGGGDGRQVYTASLVGAGLHLSPNAQGEGGVIAAADGTETVFTANLGGNTSFQQRLVLTEEAPCWSVTVHNTGTEAVLMELEGTVYEFAAGSWQTIASDGPWAPRTYMVGFSSAGMAGMEGEARAVRTAVPSAAETTATVLYSLERGDVTCDAASLSRYVFYTNSTEIAVSLAGADVAGNLTLLDISQGSAAIQEAQVEADASECTFSGLTASRRYQLAWDGPAEVTLTVGDG